MSKSQIITIYQGETAKELDLITKSLDKANINYYKSIDPCRHPGWHYLWRWRYLWLRPDYFPFEIKILLEDETLVSQIIADLEFSK